ncbi:MAG: hypothetical protein HQL56_03610 [Magnetococcales bacterium]|nr:hypothetical protein [Magnetococcales bacterium]
MTATRTIRRHALGLLMLSVLTAGCATTTPSPEYGNFTRCLNEAREMDQQCQLHDSPGKCLSAARRYENCSGDTYEGASEEERMKAMGLAILDYARGGDWKEANRVREGFEGRFRGKDLHLGEERCSLLDTLKALPGRESANLRVSNACEQAKLELRRNIYWLSH